MFCENLFWSRYLYIAYKVKLSLTDFVFKKRSSASNVLLLIMKRNELFVTVSILVSIISLIFLNKAINKIQCTNHLTFKECGKKGGRKEKRGRRKEKRGGRKEERRGRKEKTTHCAPLVYRRRTDNTKKNTIIRYLYIVYKVKLSLTDFVFKKGLLHALFCCSSASISFIFLNILFVFIRWEHNPQHY